MRQCKEMVAANWIRYAGRVVERLCFEPITEHYGPVRWRQWANKLSHIEIKHANSPELCEATGEARRMMIEMHPELFEREKRSVVKILDRFKSIQYKYRILIIDTVSQFCRN